jgi:hypothetical protein
MVDASGVVTLYRRNGGTGCWHVCEPLVALSTAHACPHGCRFIIRPAELPLYDHLEVPLAEIPDRALNCGIHNAEYYLGERHILFCYDCRKILMFYKQALEGKMTQIPDADLTRPVVIGPCGIAAFSKTLKEAETQARKLAKRDQREYVVFMPRTSFSPQTPPIKVKRFK